jgi:hypothetical protein
MHTILLSNIFMATPSMGTSSTRTRRCAWWDCMTWGKRVTGVYRHQALVAQLAGSNIR